MSSTTSSGAVQRVWFITGTSSGLGLNLTQLALAQGDCVIATAKKPDAPPLQALLAEYPQRCQVLPLDVRAEYATIQACVEQAISFYGRVDIVVNNAGNGHIGMLEEGGYEVMQMQMDVNTFGPLKITQAFLPHMRKRREGTLVYISSRSSFRARNPIISFYAASKAALDAYVASLATEVKPLGIRVLDVLPGALKTSTWTNAVFINPSVETPPDASPFLQTLFEDYKPTRAPRMQWALQQGTSNPEQASADPVKAAQAIIDVVLEKDGKPCPEFLALGEDAERDIREQCEYVLAKLDEWKDVTRSITLTSKVHP